MNHDDIINEVHSTILREWSEETLNEFFITGWSDSSLSKYHMNLGQYIRNKYNLWEIPWEPVMEEFHGCMCDCSPYHPDAVSNTIIKEVWKRGQNEKV